MSELREIELEKLEPHPDNPRIALRENVVSGICEQIKKRGRLDESGALLVRLLDNGKFQVVKGHQRLEAAIRAGIATVPCWVEEMEDAEALWKLVADPQAERAPIEIGLGALKVEKAMGGAGETGGLSELAGELGLTQQYISQLYTAAEGLAFYLENWPDEKPTTQVVGFLKKAKHLFHIVQVLPQDIWIPMMDWLFIPNSKGKYPSAAAVERVCKKISSKIVNVLRGDEPDVPNEWESVFLSAESLRKRLVFDEKKAMPSISQLIDLADKTENLIAENVDALSPIYTVEKYHDWLSENSGEDSWNRENLREYWQGVLEMVEDKLEIVYGLWLSCHSIEEIKKETKLGQSIVEMLIEEARKVYLEDKVPDSLQTFNLWTFQDCDSRYGTDGFPGRIPGQIVENVLYYYTKPFDVVVDPMAGGGTTLDVCKEMRRRYRCYDIDPKRDDVVQHDVTTGFPEESHGCDLVFLDPPYWKQKKGDYSGDETNLVNMSLPRFYKEMGKIFVGAERILKSQGYVAVIVGPTQAKGIIHDHALRFAEMLKRDFVFVNRIVVPYTTQQAKPYHVTDARAGRYMLKLYRDVLVFKKEV